MSLSESQMQEITGPVVAVDDDDFNRDTNPVPAAIQGGSGERSSVAAATSAVAGRLGLGGRSKSRSHLTIKIPKPGDAAGTSAATASATNGTKQQHQPTSVGDNGTSGGLSVPGTGAESASSTMTTVRVGSVRGKTQAHQIVSGSGDILTRGNSSSRSMQPPAGKDKFSSLVNDYVGNCLEENCNIGE